MIVRVTYEDIFSQLSKSAHVSRLSCFLPQINNINNGILLDMNRFSFAENSFFKGYHSLKGFPPNYTMLHTHIFSTL